MHIKFMPTFLNNQWKGTPRMLRNGISPRFRHRQTSEVDVTTEKLNSLFILSFSKQLNESNSRTVFFFSFVNKKR